MSDQNTKKGSLNDGWLFTHVSVSELKATYSPLRAGNLPLSLSEALNPLPIRVVPTDDGHFEIIDGFKRFAAWQSEGREEIPVIIERSVSVAEQKKLLLSANSPARTLTPLDEGLVIRSLLEEDQMKPAAVAKLLGRKKKWVIQRAVMVKQLSPAAQKKLGSGEIGPTIGKLLTSLKEKEQDELLNCFSEHKLRACDQQIIIQAYRISDSSEKKELLASPAEVLSQNSRPAFSTLTNALEKRLKRGLDAIDDLQSFQIPPELSSSESRRLNALVKQFLKKAMDALAKLSESIAAGITRTTAANVLNNHQPKIINEEKTNVKTQEENVHQAAEQGCSGRGSGDDAREQQSKDLRLSGHFPESCGKCSGKVRDLIENPCAEEVEAYGLQGGDHSTCDRRPDDDQNSARDQGAWFQREENHFGRDGERPSTPGTSSEEEAGQAKIRNPCRGGTSGRLVPGNRCYCEQTR